MGHRVWWFVAGTLACGCGAADLPSRLEPASEAPSSHSTTSPGETDPDPPVGGDDEPEAPPDEPTPPSSPRPKTSAAGFRLSPIVWKTAGGLRDHEAAYVLPHLVQRPEAADMLDPWWDHELGISCAFRHEVSRCLPRRYFAEDTDPQRRWDEPVYGDPNCAGPRFLEIHGRDDTPFARRVSRESPRDGKFEYGFELVEIVRLGDVEVRTAYEEDSYGGCKELSNSTSVQRILDVAPMELFVGATVHVDETASGRIVPLVMQADDGAWRVVDLWDTELGTRVALDTSVDTGVWAPSISFPAWRGLDALDNVPDQGHDGLGWSERRYANDDCTGPTFARVDADATIPRWVRINDPDAATTTWVELDDRSHSGPAYVRAADGGCSPVLSTGEVCRGIAREADLTLTPAATRVDDDLAGLQRAQFIADDGTPFMADGWWLSATQFPCQRRVADDDRRVRCFPVEPSRFMEVCPTETCDQGCGYVLEGLTSPPPPYLTQSADSAPGTSEDDTARLMEATWIEVDTAAIWVPWCDEAGCHCYPGGSLKGPRAFIAPTDSIGPALPSDVLPEFVRVAEPVRTR